MYQQARGFNNQQYRRRTIRMTRLKKSFVNDVNSMAWEVFKTFEGLKKQFQEKQQRKKMEENMIFDELNKSFENMQREMENKKNKGLEQELDRENYEKEIDIFFNPNDAEYCPEKQASNVNKQIKPFGGNAYELTSHHTIFAHIYMEEKTMQCLLN